VLLGEGCGGGALALLPCRRVVVAENAWLSPLPPEGASTILHGTPERAVEMAERQRIGSTQLVEDGIAHAFVAETVPAHEAPESFCTRIADEIEGQLQLQRADDQPLAGLSITTSV
jgi:acetyl-CoA carboxylase alpha subunit